MVAITPIPNRPQTVSLNGTEVVPGVQSGANVKIPISQIGAYTLTLLPGNVVTSFNTRTGAVTLQLSDVTGVGGAPLSSPAFTGTPSAPTPSPGDNTTKLATTAFVTTSFAPLASPAFTGSPSLPTGTTGVTQTFGTNNTTISTTAFVQAAVVASVSGVASFNTRTGVVTLSGADLTGAGGALLASPTFTGTPAAPTASPGTNTTQLSTTAFAGAASTAAVQAAASSSTPLMDGSAAVGAGTTWARADHVHPTDTSLAPLASPTFTGTPAAPTASAATNTTQLATTAFVTTAGTAFLPKIGGVMSGALTVSQTAGIVGTTTNNNANAGSFGEYVTATLSSPASLGNLLKTNLTNISLTAGDWDVEGVVNFDDASNSMYQVNCGVSSTSITLPAASAAGGAGMILSAGTLTNAKLSTGAARFSLSTTTTIFLVAQTAYTTGPVNASGTIRARRVR